MNPVTLSSRNAFGGFAVQRGLVFGDVTPEQVRTAKVLYLHSPVINIKLLPVSQEAGIKVYKDTLGRPCIKIMNGKTSELRFWDLEPRLGVSYEERYASIEEES